MSIALSSSTQLFYHLIDVFFTELPLGSIETLEQIHIFPTPLI